MQRSSTNQFAQEIQPSNSRINMEENFGRHRTFTWVTTEMGEENVHIEDAEVATEHGVPRVWLVKCIKSEIAHEEAFLTLPWAFLLVATFAVCLLGHDRTNELRDIEAAVNVDLHENAVFAYSGNMAHKEINDAHYIPDVFTWLRVGLAPLLFRSHKWWSESFAGIDTPLTDVEKSSYLQHNRLVGGVRLSQTRAVAEDCKNQELAGTYDMICQPQSAGLDLTTQPEYLDIIQMKEKYDHEHTRWFLLGEDPDSVLIRLQQLETANWIDDRTRHVAVHFLTYNAHFNCLTHNGAHFFFARTGRLWKKVAHSGVFLDSYENWWIIPFDILFVLLNIRLVGIEILDVYKSFKHHHEKGKQSHSVWIMEYLNFWNFVDWVSIALSITLIIMWMQTVGKMQDLQEELLNVAVEETSQALDFSKSVIFQGHLDDLMLHFEDAYNYQHTFRTLGSIFPICLMLRLFKAFSSQPRLALVTQTLSLALVDIIHFGVVFITIFCTFCVMAIGLFGREMHEFSTFELAFSSCFLVLMGDFDYGAMFSEARVMGTIWFWAFQIVLVLIMLNMLLAIIMDTYSEVKDMSSDSETLPEQLLILIQRWHWKQQGVGLSLEQIDQKLAARFGKVKKKTMKAIGPGYRFDPNDTLTVQSFVEAIDGMEVSQAQRLMTHAVHDWRHENLEPLSMSEAMNVISQSHRHQLHQMKSTAQNHQETSDRIDSLEAKMTSMQLSLQRMEELLRRGIEPQADLNGRAPSRSPSEYSTGVVDGVEVVKL